MGLKRPLLPAGKKFYTINVILHILDWQENLDNQDKKIELALTYNSNILFLNPGICHLHYNPFICPFSLSLATCRLLNCLLQVTCFWCWYRAPWLLPMANNTGLQEYLLYCLSQLFSTIQIGLDTLNILHFSILLPYLSTNLTYFSQ